MDWLYVDFVAGVSKSDKEYDPKNPCQVVQLRPRKYYNGFPFDEKDKRFKKDAIMALYYITEYLAGFEKSSEATGLWNSAIVLIVNGNSAPVITIW